MPSLTSSFITALITLLSITATVNGNGTRDLQLRDDPDSQGHNPHPTHAPAIPYTGTDNTIPTPITTVTTTVVPITTSASVVTTTADVITTSVSVVTTSETPVTTTVIPVTTGVTAGVTIPVAVEQRSISRGRTMPVEHTTLVEVVRRG